MYWKHPDLDTPPPEALLWRYMDFTKFVSLLHTHALFFARADKLGDPFEGALAELNMLPQVKQALFPGIEPENIDSIYDHLCRLRETTLVNCWYESDVESDAMWRLAIHTPTSIAVSTDFESLSSSLTCQDMVFIGRVTYVDYDAQVIPTDNVLYPFFHKRRGFEHEREVRAIVIDFTATTEPPEVGAYFEVDLSTLVTEIIVAPYADDWFVELVRSVAAKYGLDTVVRKSHLGQVPAWMAPHQG